MVVRFYYLIYAVNANNVAVSNNLVLLTALNSVKDYVYKTQVFLNAISLKDILLLKTLTIT